MTFVPWVGGGLGRTGWDPRSAYVERFWVGVVGPSVIWLMRLLAREFDELESGVSLTLDMEEVARRLGLRYRGGRHSSLMRALNRAELFRLIRRRYDGVIEVACLMPPVPQRMRGRLPERFQQEIGQWSLTEAPRSFAETGRMSGGGARLLATCLAQRGHGQQETAERLIMLGVSPPLARQAAAGAWEERCRQVQRSTLASHGDSPIPPAKRPGV